jgi:hypothetical protein
MLSGGGEKMSVPITPEVWETIEKILRRGDTVELKRENGRLVIVEITRKVKTKTSING